MLRIGFVAAFAGLAALSNAAGPFALSVGSGDGSLQFTSVYSNGYIDGDDGLFDPAGGTSGATTVWRNDFMVHNVTDNLTFWSEDPNVGHTPSLPDGTVTNNSTSITNSGINYGSDLTGDLAISLAAVTAGQSARLNFQWTLNNAGASAKTVRIQWFFDGDSYLDSVSYSDDLAVRVANTMASGPAVAVGEGIADASVNGAKGVIAECSVPVKIFGVNDLPTGAYGSSNYWSNEGNYVGNGPEVNKDIAAAYVNKVQNDGNDNGAADGTGDAGAVLQAEVIVPASGSQTVTFRATWGNDVVYTPIASVNNWSLY